MFFSKIARWKARTPPKKHRNNSLPSVIKRRNYKVRKLVIGAVVGYVGGVLLTYMWFLFFATQLNFSLTKSTNMGIVLAVVLTCGLAFSRNVRCIVVLILPNFFSVKGRSALIAYTFVLTVTGPTRNIVTNIDILSTSLSCGQEQLKEALEGMLEIIKRPLYAIKNAVKLAIRAMKKTVEKIAKILKMVKELIVDLLKAIKNAFEWLANIVNICNKQIGTPFQRCIDLFEEAEKECRSRLGPMAFLCNATYVVKAICYAVKFIDYICVLVDFVSDAIVGTVTRKLKIFVDEIKNIFYVSVKFDHKFRFETHASKNLTQVGAEILADIRKRSRGVFFIMGWMEMLASLFFLRILLKALVYKSKYLHHDRFDNKYITKDFVVVEEKRRKLGKECVLPLTRKEGKRYIPITSCCLVRAEKLKLARSAMFLIITTVQIFTTCVVDYSLYWVLWKIRSHGRKMAGIEAPDIISVNVSGSGFIADIYEGIINAFSPMAEKFDIDPIPCLPDPRPPKFDRYFQIGVMLIMCWALLIFEPYGLRFRQIVMRSFYPARSKERAVWLHSHILMRRRKLIIYLNRLEEVIQCQRPGCKGKYCKECFSEMRNICFLCTEPLEYGDLSDVSEEKDSSDDEPTAVTINKNDDIKENSYSEN